jgi:hypothetical protein
MRQHAAFLWRSIVMRMILICTIRRCIPAGTRDVGMLLNIASSLAGMWYLLERCVTELAVCSPAKVFSWRILAGIAETVVLLFTVQTDVSTADASHKDAMAVHFRITAKFK